MQIIANIGINWWTKKNIEERAFALVNEAIEAKVSAICTPYLDAEKMFRPPEIVKKTKQYDMPPELLYDLVQHIHNNDLEVYVSPRHVDQVAYLEKIGVTGYHINNGDMVYLPLLEAVAKTGKPVLLSTGFSTMKEVGDAVAILLGDTEPSESNLIILHSTGALPTPLKDINLGRILDLAGVFFPLYVGFESFAREPIIDYISMALRPIAIMRRIDLADKAGIETEYSLSPTRLRELVSVAAAMDEINHPVEYANGFTESDYDARQKQRRCAESDYLLPPTP